MRKVFLVMVVLGAAGLARADEGMWTYNNFPKAKMQKKYNTAPDDKQLEHLRLSSARLAQGCSASFVSPNGLVMTNHHCAHSCIEQLSTAQKDFVASGFYAETQDKEVKCPELEVNQLTEITDVTERVAKATKGLADQKYNEAEKAELSKIEKECAGGDEKLRCDVVRLYNGGVYNLYKYRRHQDVRLVFAPEFQIAFFGGDPDNFNFPRYDLDTAFVRVYEDGKPAQMSHYLTWGKGDLKEGDIAYVSGHPGGTSRQLTVAELEYLRDLGLPARILRLAEMRGFLTEFGKRSPEAKRISNELLFSVENALKALRGRQSALLDKRVFGQKVTDEAKLRQAVAKKGDLKAKYAGAWDAIAKSQEELKKIHNPLTYLEGYPGRFDRGAWGFSSDLFDHARHLVRAADEREKPNEKRFREYTDGKLPSMKQKVLSTAPIYDDLEILTLTFTLTKLREELTADHELVKKVLGQESPEELAKKLVKGSKLKDLALRKKLWEGGKAAVDASDDPMIALVKKIDGDSRALRKKFEDDIESVWKKNAELVSKARFAVQGTSTYPDATFTLRLSYGIVKGWDEAGKYVKPITDFAGAFARATGRAPFDLPQTWLAAKAKVEPSTPFNFATTNDIIGGNSGSPVANAKGEVVGLVFDGNIHSLGGDYAYDEVLNRTVAVHAEAIIHALEKIYRADRIVNELRPRKTAER